MTGLVHNIASNGEPEKTALIEKNKSLSFAELNDLQSKVCNGLNCLGLKPLERVAVYLPKTFENIASMLGTNSANGVFVPVNPNLKADQVKHIVNDCDVKVIITNKARYKAMADVISELKSISHVILTDLNEQDTMESPENQILTWSAFISTGKAESSCKKSSPYDMAAILYTSGSTGKPKGVVLSHQNLVLGAESVSEYLNITSNDVILAMLPLSFDYGLNQVLTALQQGATCVLHDYFLPSDVLKKIERHEVTALAGVPPLWNQLFQLDWPTHIASNIRYITNSGGAFSEKLKVLAQEKLPNADIYAMYGLTEAFRSTYLPPSEIDRRPNSMGKAIPNAEILIVRENGEICDDNEVGELVHRGPLVSLGYWNQSERTAQRFKPAPGVPKEIQITEMAVYSGDLAYRDSEGFLFFVGRNDEMIKSSGYRVSPGEIEEVILQHESVSEAAAFGIQHDELGQAILVVLSTTDSLEQSEQLKKDLKLLCQQKLANYMVPKEIIVRNHLPRNNNQKIDRASLKQEYKDYWA